MRLLLYGPRPYLVRAEKSPIWPVTLLETFPTALVRLATYRFFRRAPLGLPNDVGEVLW